MTVEIRRLMPSLSMVTNRARVDEMRKEEARLDLPLFEQTTDFTCGACATLMVWKYFDRSVELSRRNEFLIWTETAALPFKFSSPYRIASFFVKKGFETKLLIEEEMSGEGKVPLECCSIDAAQRTLFLDFFKSYNAELERQIASNIVRKKPAPSDIRRALFRRSPVIALVDSYYTVKARGARNPVHLPHWVVVTGYEDERFRINDPIRESGLKPGRIVMGKSVLQKAMDTYSRFGWPSALVAVERKGESASSNHRLDSMD